MLNVNTIVRDICKSCGRGRKDGNATMELLAALQTSSYMFYLTGSRFFGNYTCDSDYDFFANQGAIPELKKLRFTCVASHDYNDYHCLYVFRHDLGVDVQIVRNVDMKAKAQELIFQGFMSIYNSLDKQNRDRLWDFASMFISGQSFNYGKHYMKQSEIVEHNKFKNPHLLKLTV